MVMAAQQANNTAMLGQIKGLQKRDRAVEADHAFNWTMTYAGKDVASFIRECVLGIVTDGKERDLLLQMIEAVTRFLLRSDKDKDRKVLLASLVSCLIVPGRTLSIRSDRIVSHAFRWLTSRLSYVTVACVI